jgi:uncharacterized membrane protein YjjB (DUF3815 family)
MEQGVSQEIATLFGCLVIGLIAAAAVERLHLPLAALAFAGAVTMMPGAFIYESIAGAVQMSTAGRDVDPALAAITLALSVKAAFVIGAMVIGLLAGARLARFAGLLMRRMGAA